MTCCSVDKNNVWSLATALSYMKYANGGTNKHVYFNTKCGETRENKIMEYV